MYSQRIKLKTKIAIKYKWFFLKKNQKPKNLNNYQIGLKFFFPTLASSLTNSI